MLKLRILPNEAKANPGVLNSWSCFNGNPSVEEHRQQSREERLQRPDFTGSLRLGSDDVNKFEGCDSIQIL
ncbi:MAG: hypothetical protein ACRER2_02730 [Methylococcales bacterium]